MKSIKVTKDNPNWYLGLDIGTNSVGFCATNEKYEILTKGNKLQSGARLFDSAQDASERRLKRSNRRRLDRRHVRLQLLREIFAPAIDDKFFLAMDESFLCQEDKQTKNKYSLFNDENYTDSNFYNDFPTIYHLRKHLAEKLVKDVRLVYLACHHLMKYRGHFLFNQFKVDKNQSSYLDIVNDINEYISYVLEDEENVQFSTDEIDKKLSEAKKSKRITDIWDNVFQVLNPQGNSILKTICNYLKGNKITFNCQDLWDDISDKIKELELSDKAKDFSFKEEKFDAVFEEFIDFGLFDENRINLILNCKRFYDQFTLDIILNGSSTISEAQVKRYDEHHQDLHNLKSFF